MAMYGQPSLRKTNAGWDREAFIACARYRALNFEARSRELGDFICGVEGHGLYTTFGYKWRSLHNEQNLSRKYYSLYLFF